MFLLSERSTATVSTRTFDFCAIADFAAASISAVRDTMITLHPSAASTSAVARPMPFEPPVISAVLPAIFRSMGVPRKGGLAGGRTMRRARPYHNTLCGRLRRRDHAPNALAVAHLRTKSEIARRRFDIDQPARLLWRGGVDLELHEPACRRAGFRD